MRVRLVSDLHLEFASWSLEGEVLQVMIDDLAGVLGGQFDDVDHDDVVSASADGWLDEFRQCVSTPKLSVDFR